VLERRCGHAGRFFSFFFVLAVASCVFSLAGNGQRGFSNDQRWKKNEEETRTPRKPAGKMWKCGHTFPGGP